MQLGMQSILRWKGLYMQKQKEKWEKEGKGATGTAGVTASSTVQTC